MTALRVDHTCIWVMNLSDSGYATWELQETDGRRRWGWTINAGASGWVAHVGEWGRAVGVAPLPLFEELKSVDTLAEAKTWIEETIAHQWNAITA